MHRFQIKIRTIFLELLLVYPIINIIKDCGACGNRIVSDVDGNIGICEGMVGNAEYFFKRNNFM